MGEFNGYIAFYGFEFMLIVYVNAGRDGMAALKRHTFDDLAHFAVAEKNDVHRESIGRKNAFCLWISKTDG
jgi:hypothetical protein